MARASSDELTKAPAPRTILPFEGHIAPWEGGWSVLMPVRAEECTLEKQSVVYEEVTVRTDQVEDVQHVTASVLHEELTVDAQGIGRHERPTVRLQRPGRDGLDRP